LVGIPYTDQQQASTFTAAIGNGLQTADERAMYQLLLDDLNTRGGVLGRKVQPVFHQINLSGTRTTEAQAACADFTQDHHVHVALGGTDDFGYWQCLTKAGVPVMPTSNSPMNEADYAAFPGLLHVDGIAFDRLASIEAERLTATGFFSGQPSARVGILFFDEPHFRRGEQALEAALAQRKVNVADRQAIHYFESTSDVGQTETEVQNSILRFRSSGVTHVVSVETNAWLQGGFALGASQQQYYPRYGWTSNQVLSNVLANVPARALQGSLFVGWDPVFDLVDAKQYGPETRACLDFMARHGQPVDTGNQRASAARSCEVVKFFAAALSAGKGVSRDQLLAGAQALGTTYRPIATFDVRISQQRPDGIAAVRDGAYDERCTCFAYTSGLITTDTQAAR
jgi:hypothetical protein